MMLREPGCLTMLPRIQMFSEVWWFEDPMTDCRRRRFIVVAVCANRDLFGDELAFDIETLQIDNGEHYYSFR